MMTLSLSRTAALAVVLGAALTLAACNRQQGNPPATSGSSGSTPPAEGAGASPGTPPGSTSGSPGATGTTNESAGSSTGGAAGGSAPAASSPR